MQVSPRAGAPVRRPREFITLKKDSGENAGDSLSARIASPLSGVGSGRQFVVACQYLWVSATEAISQFFHHINGTMAATGATNRDSKITAIGATVILDPVVKEARNIVLHSDRALLIVEVSRNFGILTRQRSQFFFPIRVRQAAHIEDKVRICRDAFAVRKRFEQE